MNIITKEQMRSLMEEYPDGGIVFAEYTPGVLTSSIMVTDGSFGAREVVPHEGVIAFRMFLRKSYILIHIERHHILE